MHIRIIKIEVEGTFMFFLLSAGPNPKVQSSICSQAKKSADIGDYIHQIYWCEDCGLLIEVKKATLKLCSRLDVKKWVEGALLDIRC